MTEQIDGEIVDRVASLPAQVPFGMVARAIDKGLDVAALEKLIALEERHNAAIAYRAFSAAISAAAAEFPAIERNARVQFETKGGAKTDYRHETLGDIVKAVSPIMARHGLSHRYCTEQVQSGVRVTCIISHKDGHIEKTSLEAAADSSGNKNTIQAVGSTVTYLQRYTLKAALGLAVVDADDDGVGASPAAPQYITADQYIELQELIEKASIREQAVLDAEKVASLQFLPAGRFDKVRGKLENTIANKAGAK